MLGSETFWVAAGVILTVLTVAGGALWNGGQIKKCIDFLERGHLDHEVRIRATEMLGADHAARIVALEQWNQGFDSAARVSNKTRVPRPKPAPPKE